MKWSKWAVWPVSLIVAMVLGAIGWAVISGKPLFQATNEERNSQIVKSIERQEQVVLVSLGIQGILEQQAYSTIFGVGIPGSGRAMFMQYSYKAKLGIDGRKVTIRQTGDSSFVVSIPEFIFIGHDGEAFRTVVEDNGILSWFTPEIDKAATITKILNDDTKQSHITDNRDILEDQARNFYGGIIRSIDPQS